MILKRDPTKALQLGFLTLLIFSTILIAFWIMDLANMANDDRDRIVALYEADALAVTAMLAEAAERLPDLMPHLEIDPINNTASVKMEAVQTLHHRASSKINRYTWEGGFFLLVLLGGMTVLTRTIRHDTELRKRQQNFLAAVSHEFKSPLASMRLSAETLVMRTDDSNMRRLGQRMIADGERLLRMVDNLLDTTRIEDGKLKLISEPISLLEAVQASTAESHERALISGINIRIQIADDLRIVADRTTLETVLRNLMDNAIKACTAGNGTYVEVSGKRLEGFIKFSVQDDGLGFPPEDAAMIFEKFYRLGDELRRSTPGTGLGLYIVRQLVALSGAQIMAESKGPGKGATINVIWPIAEMK
jgi:two-component system phosphate regulon sensor histidine kinase PhoR